jgi:hypothetical protein
VSGQRGRRRCPTVPVACGSVFADPVALQQCDSFGPRGGRDASAEAADVGAAGEVIAVSCCDAVGLSVLVWMVRCAEHQRSSALQRRCEQRPGPGAEPRRPVMPLLTRRFQRVLRVSSDASGSVTAVAAASAACAWDQLQRRGARAAAECPRRRRVEWSARGLRSDACVLRRTEFDAPLRAGVQAAVQGAQR